MIGDRFDRATTPGVYGPREAASHPDRSLPLDAAARKRIPLFTGPMLYFPDAMRELSRACYVGNEQHHPGSPLHWDRSKSMDHMDCALRHMLDSATVGHVDSDGVYHLAKGLWRLAAELQLTLERDKK